MAARSSLFGLQFEQKLHGACENDSVHCRDLVRCWCRGRHVLLGSKTQERHGVCESYPSAHSLSVLASIPNHNMLGSITRSVNGYSTFIRAFESLPVHCLKSLPCGKRHKPGKEGTLAMLFLNYKSKLKIY